MKVRLQSKLILWLLFYFEKESAKRMKTFKTEIKNVFQQGLKKYGFVKVKGSQPYFVRFVDNEILHIISYHNDFTFKQHYEAFVVMFGVATLYRKEITLNESAGCSGDWLDSQFFISGIETTRKVCSEEIPYTFEYEVADEVAMQKVITKAFDLTEKVILPILDKVDSLEECVKYFYRYKPALMRLYADDRYVLRWLGGSHNEGLLCTMVYGKERLGEYARNLTEQFKKDDEKLLEMIKSGKSKLTMEEYKRQECEGKEGL